MSWIVALLLGLVVGAVAKLLMPGRDPGGFIVTILLGVVGALVATWLGQALGIYREGEAAGFIGAVIGAMLLLFVYRLVAGRPRALSATARRALPRPRKNRHLLLRRFSRRRFSAGRPRRSRGTCWARVWFVAFAAR
jgi:uncharacterized membrane protein YeaQ/YmgE (transglycosylase-associated protein family)